MSGFNFADSYKAAGLTPGPDIIGLRQEPFNKLCKQVDTQIAIDLTRLYFGMEVPQGTEWFRDIFAETDPSFSMLDNTQEAAVLAACVLNAVIDNENVFAALAVLTTSVDGNREPYLLPELIEKARMALIEIAVHERRYESTTLKQFKLPAKTNIHEAADAIAAGPGWPPVAELFKQVSDESLKATKSLTTQVQEVLFPLVNQVANLQEETAILWWHIGGWSRILEKPFIEIDPGLAAVMAGLDIADLSQTIAGPAAASAILHRTVMAGRDGTSTKASIREAVEAFPVDAFEKLELSDKLKSVSDVCPVLTGFLKSHEIGESPAWESAFKKAAVFDTAVSFDLLDLAMQVYRERSLLAAID